MYGIYANIGGVLMVNVTIYSITSWLLVSTPLKNICQLEGLSNILWKIKNVPNHQPARVYDGYIISIV